jgi:transcriptional regulator with XRE-family HTH domain
MKMATTTHGAFVQAVRHRCVDLGWTAGKLAEAAGITQTTWSRITKNKKAPSLETMERVCRAVGLEIAFIPAKGGAE